MRRALIGTALLIAACGQQKHQQAAAQRPATAVTVPGMAAGQSKAALMIPIPKDRTQLKRLLAMGYTIHEDHLHAPGVTSCPKMSENPVR
jgi:hypothetical protein